MAELNWKGNTVTGDLDAAIQDALQAGGELLRDAAVQRTPVETSTLRGTAKVSTSPTKAAVSYDTVYARRQHEEIGWNHPGGGEAKYLENALLDNQDRILKAMANQIKGALS